MNTFDDDLWQLCDGAIKAKGLPVSLWFNASKNWAAGAFDMGRADV